VWYSIADQTDAGPTITLTMTWTGGNTGGADVWVARYSDADGWPADPKDGTCSGGGAGVSSTACSSAMTVAGSDNVLVCGFGAANARTHTAGTGWTIQAGANTDELWMQQTTSAPGSPTCDISWTGGTTTASVWAASFKTNAAPAAPTRKLNRVVY